MKTDIDEQDVPQEGEAFLQRWSRIKYKEQAKTSSAEQAVDSANQETELVTHLTDEDMPPIETLTEESDFSGFFSPRVSEELRKLALRKLFSSTVFNVRDGLDDYDEEFTTFEKLGDIITADMKHQLEMESRKQIQQAEAENNAEEIHRDDMVAAEPENTQVAQSLQETEHDLEKEIETADFQDDDTEVI